MTQMSLDGFDAVIEADGKADHLYVIGTGNGSGIVKIGRSVNPGQRLRNLQVGNPQKVRIIHLVPRGGYLEPRLHEKLAANSIGGEWFDFGARDPLKVVAAVINDVLAEQRTPVLVEATDVRAAAFPYEQLAAYFRERIRSGEYGPGARLPSITEIAGRTGLTAKTIQHAMRVLAGEGLVVVRPNRGTFVVRR